MGRAIMVQGTASSAGTSLLTTALCAHATRAGVAVAPFKAQNMSNNARVVDGGGGEIGAAQALQARAAGVRPDVRMNPVLVKPEADTRSQLIRLGRVDHALSARRGEERSAALWDDIRTCRTVDGYEIRHGRTIPPGDLTAALPAGRGFADGNVLGVSVHGLLEDARLVRALLDVELTPLTETFDLLADTVAEHLDPTVIDDLCTPGRRSATRPPSATPAAAPERRHR
ncbi:MAG TPA: hypothetical protein VFZ70_11555 [Euzebyales bacterium]